jgi:hypothetical protein
MILGIALGFIYFVARKFFSESRVVLLGLAFGALLLLGFISPTKYASASEDVGSLIFIFFTILIIDALFEGKPVEKPTKPEQVFRHKGKTKKHSRR